MLTTINKETMSHVEIANLVGSRSDTVKASIERLSEKGVITFTAMAEKSTGGRPSTNYLVNERDSYIVVAQLSPEFTAFLVDEWQKRKSQPVLTQEQQVLAIAHQLIKTTEERDVAIKTKAQINDKRTATLMNKASQDSKRIKKLEAQVQNEGTHRSTLAAKLPVYVDVNGVSKSVSVILRNISEDMELPRKEVPCERYGKVWAYHVDVIAQFKEMYL